MPVPSPRTPICVARGNKADLLANLASIQEGEIAYAFDEDALYVKEGGTLVRTTAALGIATNTTLGGIKIGANLTVASDGTVSAAPPTTSLPPGVQNLDLLQWDATAMTWAANRITDGGNF